MKEIRELFDKALNVVLEESELTFDELTTSRSEKSVNARVVFVDYLLNEGLSEITISEISGMSQQRVNALKNSRIYRMKTMMCRILSENLKNKMRGSVP